MNLPPDPTPLPLPLALWPGDDQADALGAALQAAGLSATPGAAGHLLLGIDAAAAATERPAGPASAFGPAPEPAALRALLAAGLSGWWPAAVLADPAALRAALACDQARWQHDSALRAELARARGQLDERKFVDRAKGLLMSARGIGEDEAFRLLRGAAMHANLRVGEVSRSVIEASQWADAINRAGQLRFLSQRLVKLAAQRLAGIDARRTRGLQDEAAARVQANLEHLAAGAVLGQATEPARTLLAEAQEAWAALDRALAQRLSAASVAESDRCAMRLMQAGDALATALEQGGERRALRLVNLCGRQRMRVQRVAKDALLATLLGEPGRRDALAPLLDDFEATLLELERAPLGGPETREDLAAARDSWLHLLRGLRAADEPEGRALLAAASDALLERFDRLTAGYERSLQVIMS